MRHLELDYELKDDHLDVLFGCPKLYVDAQVYYPPENESPELSELEIRRSDGSDEDVSDLVEEFMPQLLESITHVVLERAGELGEPEPEYEPDRYL